MPKSSKAIRTPLDLSLLMSALVASGFSITVLSTISKTVISGGRPLSKALSHSASAPDSTVLFRNLLEIFHPQ
ncbi:hypothetical protein IMCC1933_04180 [Rhodobacteraceae bacterium IMCC1933]|nr:hypothetical protein [Rhodobacteraceae bacterium IMCC1923]MDP4066882.1 hypothetical protein [Rhodobacteraceae bacterium IMCC1933]MDP4072051.1 hypothetical protein [Rhodobacteraceae bacterium IMCC1909]